MTVLDVLSTIRQAGGSVVVVDGNLKIKAPAGLLTPEHKAVLAVHKALLVSLLSQPRELDCERDAIQREDEPAPPPPVDEWDFPTPRAWWWSPDMSDGDNQALDEYMGYTERGPDDHEVCYKCHRKGWTWTEVRGRPRATCSHCDRFIGYGRKATA